MSQEALRVDDARVTDARDVLALHLSVLAESRWFITEPQEFRGTVEDKARQIADLTRSPTSLFLVARRGPRLCGLLTVTTGPLRRMRHAGKLEVMVAQEERGRGVGRALLAACVDWAEKNPVMEKLGLSVFADNERAIALYRSFGFEVEGHRRREYKLADGTWRDDLLMFRFV